MSCQDPSYPGAGLLQSPSGHRHCEERSDEAIPKALPSTVEIASPPTAARNDTAESNLSRDFATALEPCNRSLFGVTLGRAYGIPTYSQESVTLSLEFDRTRVLWHAEGANCICRVWITVLKGARKVSPPRGRGGARAADLQARPAADGVLLSDQGR